MHECHVDVTPSRFLMSALLDPLLPAKRLLLAALAASVIACSGRGQYAAVASAAGATAGVDPELYGAGLFSTGFWDYFMAWSPDQRDVLFCRATDDFSSFEIFATRLGKDGHWTAPRHPEFATRWSNSDPHITTDGKRVFFISNRPLPTDTVRSARATYDIWYSDRQSNGAWGEARHLDAPMNDPEGNEWSPAVAMNGNLYFGSNRPAGGRGDQDLWRSRFVDGAYLPPENLGDSINTSGAEIEPWIAPMKAI